MKPTTDLLLELLRPGHWVCTTEMVAAGVGYRFGARLHELRDTGYVLEKRYCQHPHHHHRSRTEQWQLAATPGLNNEQEDPDTNSPEPQLVNSAVTPEPNHPPPTFRGPSAAAAAGEAEQRFGDQPTLFEPVSVRSTWHLNRLKRILQGLNDEGAA